MTRSSGNLKEELEMSAHQNHLTNILKKGRPRFVKTRRNIKHSSAMSDTSEAPSIASHVRRVRVPSQASDVDQFLDDLFMPVLDVEDGLSDAKSLAASMKGGGGKKKKKDDLSKLTDAKELALSIQGCCDKS
ncbi:Myosin 15 [Caligus rogercresseyi]|uniref:Myosin 15 n=1 Tax=Caligus rogercresseyi TaxID=217165 RepID=A0A7T8JV90_CALRO|nr:Myosin 15 [Caligus rogercresseyi]